MSHAYLSSLLNKYSPYASEEICATQSLAKKYRALSTTSLLDLAATATGISNVSRSLQDLDPLALKALQDTNPNFGSDVLHLYSESELQGIINSAKGKYFEYLVADRLNAGETVGDVTLPHGFSVELAESVNQPGWDLQILDEAGNAVDFLQLKATESINYITDTLEKYPDIAILTTHEAASELPHDYMVLDSKISDAGLESVIERTLEDSNVDIISEFWEIWNPIVPLLVIAATEGYRVAFTETTLLNSVNSACQRATRSFLAGVVGSSIKLLTDSWMLSATGVLVTGMFFERASNIKELTESLAKMRQRSAYRSEYYKFLARRLA